MYMADSNSGPVGGTRLPPRNKQVTFEEPEKSNFANQQQQPRQQPPTPSVIPPPQQYEPQQVPQQVPQQMNSSAGLHKTAVQMASRPQPAIVPQPAHVPEGVVSKFGSSMKASSNLKMAIIVTVIYVLLNSKIVWKQILKLPYMGGLEPSMLALVVNSILAGIIFFIINKFVLKN